MKYPDFTLLFLKINLPGSSQLSGFPADGTPVINQGHGCSQKRRCCQKGVSQTYIHPFCQASYNRWENAHTHRIDCLEKSHSR